MEKREEESAVWGSVAECSGEVGVMPAGCSRGGEDGLRGRGRAERESGEGISRKGGSAEENGGWRDEERVRESGEGERVQRWRESDRE